MPLQGCRRAEVIATVALDSGICEEKEEEFIHIHPIFPSGVSNNTRCYGELGCLDVDESWYGLTRPVNVRPLDREDINTTFMLVTRETFPAPDYLQWSYPESVLRSAYNASKPTKFIIHGFLDNGRAPWVGVSHDKKRRTLAAELSHTNSIVF